MMEKCQNNDYYVRHGEASNSESGLSFLAKISPEKTEIYSSSIMFGCGLDEESSSFVRVHNGDVSKA